MEVNKYPATRNSEEYPKKKAKIPEFNLCRALLILTDVELIPPQRPLSEDMVTITFFLTSTPNK